MTTVRKRRDEIPPMSKERAKELEAMSDDDIDLSDIPELDEDFFKNAKLVDRKPRTEALTSSPPYKGEDSIDLTI